MMYISVYPIALSVRSTNVYEEKSLGLFNDEPDDEFESNEQGAQAVAKYLGWHARRQLAFGEPRGLQRWGYTLTGL